MNEFSIIQFSNMNFLHLYQYQILKKAIFLYAHIYLIFVSHLVLKDFPHCLI